VLPLLDAPEERRFTEAMFALRLVEWLDEFDEPIDLFSDSPMDWNLLADAIRDARGKLRQPLKAFLARVESPDAVEAEYRFWQQPENKGRQHHALLDARCLRLMRLAYENEKSLLWRITSSFGAGAVSDPLPRLRRRAAPARRRP